MIKTAMIESVPYGDTRNSMNKREIAMMIRRLRLKHGVINFEMMLQDGRKIKSRNE